MSTFGSPSTNILYSGYISVTVHLNLFVIFMIINTISQYSHTQKSKQVSRMLLWCHRYQLVILVLFTRSVCAANSTGIHTHLSGSLDRYGNLLISVSVADFFWCIRTICFSWLRCRWVGFISYGDWRERFLVL